MQDQALVTQPDKREVALARSQQVSRALHDAARKARLTVRGSAVGQWRGGSTRAGRAARTFALMSAIVLFILPTLGGAVYFGLIATDQYLVEAQFAVRARQPEPTDTLTKLTGFPALQQTQDAMVVVEYIKSRALVEKLDNEIGLRRMYSRSDINYFDRFDPEDPIEKLTRYWGKMIHAEVESSGIVNVRMRAYDPQEALKIGKAVLAACEDLINEMSMRARRHAVASAQQEVDRAEKRLVELREEVRRVRDQERVIDPKKSAEALVTLLGTVRASKIKLEDEYRVQSRVLSPNAPQMQVLKARLDALNAQIASVENEMTTSAGGAGGALARSFTSYDKALLDQQSAEKLYTVIAASLEKARMEASRQQVFIEAFVEPVLPQEAEFPRRAWSTFLVACASFAVWFLTNYVRNSIKG